MSYYFLVSSLPGLSLSAKPELSLDAFCSTCSDHLSERDQQALDAVLTKLKDPSLAHPFVRDWVARETQLRNASARLRAAKRQEDAGAFIKSHTGFDVGIEDQVEEAFNQTSPLDRERALDELRWRILDELAGTEPFGGGTVLAYGLKLQMAERWAAMDAEQGQLRIGEALEKRPHAEVKELTVVN